MIGMIYNHTMIQTKSNVVTKRQQNHQLIFNLRCQCNLSTTEFSFSVSIMKHTVKHAVVSVASLLRL